MGVMEDAGVPVSNSLGIVIHLVDMLPAYWLIWLSTPLHPCLLVLCQMCMLASLG